jgi:alpha-glucoside transport system substrate-binding protein
MGWGRTGLLLGDGEALSGYHNVSVLFQGARDLTAVLNRRVWSGNPLDLAGLPGPGQMAEYMRRGELVDLSREVLDISVFVGQYAPIWIELGTFFTNA